MFDYPSCCVIMHLMFEKSLYASLTLVHVSHTSCTKLCIMLYRIDDSFDTSIEQQNVILTVTINDARYCEIHKI